LIQRRQAPHNKWAFRNVDQVLNTQAIEKGATTSVLNSKPRSLDGFKIQLGQSPALDLASWLEYDSTDGLVLLHKGEVVHEHYANDNQADSKHIVMSMLVSTLSQHFGQYTDDHAKDRSP
jgi:hypothetical protein